MRRKEFLQAIWRDIINAPLSEVWVENVIRASKKNANGPFADLRPILESMLQTGVSRRELSLLNRFAAYEASFGLLYMLEDPCVEETSHAARIIAVCGSEWERGTVQ